MEVKLVSKTQPSNNFKGSSIEDLLVYMARVSSSKSITDKFKDPYKLIAYLIKHKHWSPFDMINLTFEVETSRAIGRQILRHWSIHPQEFSQRYAEATMPERIEFRMAGVTNRQTSEEVAGRIVITEGPNYTGIPSEFYSALAERNFKGEKLISEEAYTAICLAAQAMDAVSYAFKALIEAGIATECARMILPEAAPSTLMLNGTVRSWIHFIEVRTDLHAQKEIRIIAEEIKKIFLKECPHTSKALEWAS